MLLLSIFILQEWFQLSCHCFAHVTPQAMKLSPEHQPDVSAGKQSIGTRNYSFSGSPPQKKDEEKETFVSSSFRSSDLSAVVKPGL